MFFLSSPRHCEGELIVAIVYYFQICNKKEYNTIINRGINSHLGPCIIYLCWCLFDLKTIFRGA